MSRRRSPLEELAFLHKELHRGRTLFRITRSINRLRLVVNSFVRPFGDLSSARHAVRFDLVGKGCSTKVNDLSFALKTIRQFDASKSTTAKGVVKAAKLMASKIHQGLITGKSRRRAGSWSTQSNESALLGSSECKTYCRRITGLNRRRSKRSRLSKPVFAALEDARRTITSRNWKQSPVGLSAFTSSTRMLLKEYCRLQAAFICPRDCRDRSPHATFLHRIRL